MSAFLIGVSAVEDRSGAQAYEALEQAVRRGIVHCYTMEGSYPESLQYLKEHYGLTYDEDRFFVDYQALGSNLLPDVTIIDRGTGHEITITEQTCHRPDLSDRTVFCLRGVSAERPDPGGRRLCLHGGSSQSQ